MDILRIRNMILYFKHLTPHPLQSPWTADLARERQPGGAFASEIGGPRVGLDGWGEVFKVLYYLLS